ncbi:PVC-type heme-binding CxxCH protein [Zavarzinella formosa]|uniref:PVC-type heme-binding CxxCH protein n=1 Tax=Zavarzinella formosa TaxID=360055 RepID=UPI0002D6DE83|nr:PVC-type heme-binding CxxCH protein [Zavarzinella formosa]
MRGLLSLGLLAVACFSLRADEPKELKILFLGDNGHHRPLDRFRQFEKVMGERNIRLVYADSAKWLNAKILDKYDGLIVFANIDTIEPEQEKALLDFVASGKGFIPLHCGSYCFRNSEKYVELVGAQFQKHGTGVFRVTPQKTDHPITENFSGFESWDESYVHTKHNNKDRIVLEYREDKDGKEPWTWVRTHGKGRVFYTAWGHDERTWAHAGFVNLVERGIRWACGQDKNLAAAYVDQPKMAGPAKDLKPAEYVDAKIPFYPAGKNAGASAGPTSKMQKPMDPDESVRHYQHPADFEMKLFASEPHFGGKPIAMNWDERGRLWVCVTVDYPNEMQRPGEGRDKIVICEDTNDDGIADKYTVFADKLSIPTSITFAYGGVIVHQAPDTLFLRDTTGDDKADERYALFTGWGTRDTHAGPSNLRYGLDGWYYGMVGYSGFDGTVAGESNRFGQGFYRFKLEQDPATKKVSVTKLEFLRGTNNNSWGVGFSEEGLLFGSTANGCASVFLAVPNRYYEKVRGWSSSVLPNIALSNTYHPITDKIRQVDWHNGFTSAAGHALYTGRNYPKEYWNRTAFVSDPTGHLTATMVLQPYGSDFQARYGWNLVAGTDEWNAPIAAEVGPDGNMWVIDWYAYIVQHNPTPVGFKTGKGNAYETELRDKKHGRIYRLVAKNKSPVPNLKDATAKQLVETLKNPTMLWRLHAQRLLVERQDKSEVAALVKLVEDKSVDEIGLNVGAIHAIRTLGGLGLLSGTSQTASDAVYKATYTHPSAGVRLNAVITSAPKLLSKQVSSFLTSSSPQIALARLLALSEKEPDLDAGISVLSFLDNPAVAGDRWLIDAATAAAATHDVGFLMYVAHQKEVPPQTIRVLAIVAEHFARRAPEGEGLDLVVYRLKDATPTVADTIVTAMAKGWPKGKTAKLSPEAEKAMTDLFAKLSPNSKGSLVKLANAMGSKAFDKYAAEITKSLIDTIQNEKLSDDQRVAAARQLIEFKPNDGPTLTAILEIVTPRSSPTVAVGFLEALGQSSAPEATADILKAYPTWPPSIQAAALRAMLARTEATRQLLTAAEAGAISLNDLALDQKQGLANHPDRALAKRATALLAKGGGLPNADRQKVIDDISKLILKKTFDATAGKAMYTKHCSACHVHSGEGGKVGPDLTGMAVHPKEELLVHILDPSRSVEGNYRAYTVRTADGKVLTGLLASETKTSIELIDSQAKKFTLLREDIDSLTASNKSVMPEGFEKQMNTEEFGNLLEFLTKRGKFLPIPLDKAATIVSTKGMFIDEAATVERLIFPDWKPKTFEGVPFILVDPQGEKTPNVILLNSKSGPIPAKMPKSVTIPVNSSAKTIHLLGGVAGWASPYGEKGSVSLKVRLIYEDGKTEDHDLKNGEQIADYIRRVDVPGSKFAFNLAGRQIRYLAINPQRPDVIKQIEFVKGSDATAPVIMAVTIEGK